MTKQQFLQDTVDYYSLNPLERRNAITTEDKYGTIRVECKYTPIKQTSEGCAIGRHVKLKTAKKMDELNLPINNPRIFKLLPIKLRALGDGFLTRVQMLHDTDHYWSSTGLTDSGVDFLKQIIHLYKLGPISYKIAS